MRYIFAFLYILAGCLENFLLKLFFIVSHKIPVMVHNSSLNKMLWQPFWKVYYKNLTCIWIYLEQT